MKPAYCCGLLLLLAGNVALAQKHPPQKRRHKPVVAPNPTQAARPTRLTDDRAHCYLPFEEPRVEEPLAATVGEGPDRLYTYVEQMPTLPQASSMAGIVAAVMQRLVVPPAPPEGRVFVQFVVTKEGAVSQPRIVKGLRADADSAVVAAVRRLPRFTPGKQGGQAVAVSFTLPVTIRAPQP
jgi:TonB family protein